MLKRFRKDGGGCGEKRSAGGLGQPAAARARSRTTGRPARQPRGSGCGRRGPGRGRSGVAPRPRESRCARGQPDGAGAGTAPPSNAPGREARKTPGRCACSESPGGGRPEAGDTGGRGSGPESAGEGASWSAGAGRPRPPWEGPLVATLVKDFPDRCFVWNSGLVLLCDFSRHENISCKS